MKQAYTHCNAAKTDKVKMFKKGLKIGRLGVERGQLLDYREL